MMIQLRVTANRSRDIFLLIIAALLIGGCASDQTADRLITAQNKNIELTDKNAKLTDELYHANKTIEEQNAQIDKLVSFGAGRASDLTHVDKIELDRQTGGKGDGVMVFVSPKDDAGHVIKAAGELRVRLYDLAGEPKLLGELSLDSKDLKRKWVGRLLAAHYSVMCPFTIAPTHSDVTVQVEFVEILTGKTFSAQKLIEVKIPCEK